jgi:hypothetical protein
MVAGENVATKTLGVEYVPSKDILQFSFWEKNDLDLPYEMRRTMLKQLHRIYGPMGYSHPSLQ